MNSGAERLGTTSEIWRLGPLYQHESDLNLPFSVLNIYHWMDRINYKYHLLLSDSSGVFCRAPKTSRRSGPLCSLSASLNLWHWWQHQLSEPWSVHTQIKAELQLVGLLDTKPLWQ